MLLMIIFQTQTEKKFKIFQIKTVLIVTLISFPNTDRANKNKQRKIILKSKIKKSNDVG